MKALKKYQLNYLRHLYRKDLNENGENNDLGLAEKLDSIIEDAKLLSSTDEIMWTLKPKKHYSNKSKFEKTKQRYVFELTEKQMDDVIHSLAFAREGLVDNYWKEEMAQYKRLDNLFEKAHEIKDGPMKTIK
jgi:hypothetical protein